MIILQEYAKECLRNLAIRPQLARTWNNECKICGTTFKRLPGLREHLRIHAGERLNIITWMLCQFFCLKLCNIRADTNSAKIQNFFAQNFLLLRHFKPKNCCNFDQNIHIKLRGRGFEVTLARGGIQNPLGQRPTQAPVNKELFFRCDPLHLWPMWGRVCAAVFPAISPDVP